VEESDAHARANHETERKLEERVGLGGGLGVSGGAPRSPQQLSSCTREKGNTGGGDVRVSKKNAVHCKNLQFYLSQGMHLKKVHRVIKFNQELWMEPYIQMNTEFRKEVKSKFETNFYKLMNNLVFDKTMENLRNRIDVKIIRSWDSDKIRHLVASHSYARHEIFANELAGIHMHKTRLLLDKPIYTSMTILENSKILMYDFSNQMKA